MQMLYNSDNYVVMAFELPAAVCADAPLGGVGPLTRGGYEIVDKFARKEIYIEGAMAQHFKEAVEALIESGPTEDDVDAYLDSYVQLMQQPVVLH